MAFWTAFMLGGLGGLHCAGMCGPLMLALGGGRLGTGRFFVSRLVYQLGRVTTYGVLGLVLGLAGRTLHFAGVQRWASISLGLALLVGLFVSPRFLSLPGIVGQVVRLKGWMAGYLQRRTLASMGTLGVLNGLLPCGLVYAAGAGAATAGGILDGGLFMLAFGLGTLPVTLGISLSGRLMPRSFRLSLRHLMPLGIATMGCLLILRGLSLGIPYLSPEWSDGGILACHPPAR